MQNQNLKKNIVTNQIDSESNRNKTIDKNLKKGNYKKLIKFEHPKGNKIITINFPTISRLPQQTDLIPNYVSHNKIYPKKIAATRRELFRKFLFKNNKLHLKKRFITNPQTKANSKVNSKLNTNTINNETNTNEKIVKIEKCKSNLDMNVGNEIHYTTIGNESLKSSKLKIKESYFITNIPTESQSKIIENNNCNKNNISINKRKRMKSAKSNKSLNKNNLYNKNKNNNKHSTKNFLDKENYLNSDFIKEILSKRNPDLETIGLDQLADRLLPSHKKPKNFCTHISILPLHQKRSRFQKKPTLKIENIKEKYKKSLKNSKENKNHDNKNLKLTNRKLTNNELLNMFRNKKIRKYNFLIEKTSKNLNKMRSVIKNEYKTLINNFNYEDVWNATKNDDIIIDD